ncbi:prepilin-type N-terminal cleavage/methylation domain-containing protein [Opitutaceae bacterium TAV1]|nr:prepilin-type N-terminal cleavage/methylation domain-containing protein [Opitutaceae bacterium TAV1]
MKTRTFLSIRAFTLIELLTVIAIIGILAAIIIPTVGKVRQKAKQTQSLSNLRQIATALSLYAGDNKSRFPAGADVGYKEPFWSQPKAAGVYLGATVTQPAGWETSGSKTEQIPAFISPLIAHGKHHWISDYGCNIELLPIGSAGASLTQIDRPSRIVTVVSASLASAMDTSCSWYINTISYKSNNAIPSSGGSAFRHSDWGTGSVQAAFADGHVEQIPLGKFDENWRDYLLLVP